MSGTQETETDHSLAELSYRLAVSDPFRAVIGRARARHEHERLAANYVDLIESNGGSSQVKLKLLAAMDCMRARDISRQVVRTARIGDARRCYWPGRQVKPDHCDLQHITTHRHVNRSVQAPSMDESPVVSNIHPDKDEPLAWRLPAGARPLDFSKVLLLHMGFIGDPANAMRADGPRPSMLASNRAFPHAKTAPSPQLRRIAKDTRGPGRISH
jgi:hypothetical protein